MTYRIIFIVAEKVIIEFNGWYYTIYYMGVLGEFFFLSYVVKSLYNNGLNYCSKCHNSYPNSSVSFASCTSSR